MIFKVSSRKLFIIVAQDQKERNGLELYVVISSSLSLLPDKNLLPRPIVFCYIIHGFNTTVPEYRSLREVCSGIFFSLDKDSIQGNPWTIKHIY